MGCIDEDGTESTEKRDLQSGLRLSIELLVRFEIRVRILARIHLKY